MVERGGVLVEAWPSTSLKGGALLLDGVFQEPMKICWDHQELPPLYQDPWNTMVQVPDTATITIHDVRLIDGEGAVSAPVHVQVTDVAHPGPSYVDGEGGVLKFAFGVPKELVVPVNIYMVEPITNVWKDANSTQFLGWNINGNPANDLTVSGNSEDSIFPHGIAFRGSYDLEHRRIQVKFQGRGVAESWDYVAILSCPGNGSDYTYEVSGKSYRLCAPDFPASFAAEADMYDFLALVPRRLVFFPMTIPAHQAFFTIN
jgi:hypothetical protein